MIIIAIKFAIIFVIVFLLENYVDKHVKISSRILCKAEDSDSWKTLVRWLCAIFDAGLVAAYFSLPWGLLITVVIGFLCLCGAIYYIGKSKYGTNKK